MARPNVQDGPSLWDEEGPAQAGTDARRADDLGADGSEPEPSDRVLIVEADGGSRGNPGPAAYGALVRDADSGETLAREGLTIGVTTNNVAEYSGLIAGLEMARAIDPGARVDVRMDSKLVIEQMAGRWKIKHASMKPLALKARTLLPAEISWQWIPRAENKRADALVNSALDGTPVQRTVGARTS